MQQQHHNSHWVFKGHTNTAKFAATLDNYMIGLQNLKKYIFLLFLIVGTISQASVQR